MWDIRWLRTPFLALNLMMLAATPLFGGHYLVDMIAGAILTTASIAASRRFVARRHARAGLREKSISAFAR